MNTFENLEVWKSCRLNHITQEFSSDEKYRLADQVKRASRSVTANIAEG